MKLPEVRRGDWVIVETEKGSKIVPLSCTRMSRHQAKAIEIWAKEYKKVVLHLPSYSVMRRLMEENFLDDGVQLLVGFELHENSYGIRATASDSPNEDEGWTAVCGTAAEAIEQLAEDGLGLPYTEADERAWGVAMNSVRREFGIGEELPL